MVDLYTTDYHSLDIVHIQIELTYGSQHYFMRILPCDAILKKK